MSKPGNANGWTGFTGFKRPPDSVRSETRVDLFICGFNSILQWRFQRKPQMDGMNSDRGSRRSPDADFCKVGPGPFDRGCRCRKARDRVFDRICHLRAGDAVKSGLTWFD